MGAALRHPAIVEHHDLVRPDHGRQAMSDRDAGSVGGDVGEGCEDRFLGPAVERAGGFVEDQDGRVLEQGAGDRDPLFLAARKLQPALADLGFVTLGKRGDEAVDRCTARRSLDLGLPCAIASVADVVPDAVVEQHGVLRDDPDRRAEAFLSDVADVLPVDQDPAALGVVEAVEQPGEGRFASPRRADHRAARSGGNVEGHAFQDLAVGVVAEADVLKPEMAATDHQRTRAGGVDHFGGGIEKVEHRLHVDQPLADRTIDPAEHVERAKQLHQEAVDQHHVAGSELAAGPAPHGEAHRPGHHRVGDQALADIEPGERDFVTDRGAGVGSDRRIIAFGLALFGVEIFDGLVVQQAVDGSADRLVVDVVHLALQFRTPVGHPAGEADVECDDGERRADHSPAEFHLEDDADGDQFDERRRDVEQEEIEHHVDALGAPLDDLGQASGAPFEVKAERKIVDVAKDLRRQPAGGALTYFFKQGIAQIVEQHARKTRDGISDDQHQDHAGGLGRPAHSVDHRLVGKRHREHRCLAHQDKHDGEDHAQL